MFRLPLTSVQRDECEMNGRRQSTQELAHMIGTHSRQQKINADFLVAANAAMQKRRDVALYAAGANAFDPMIGAGYQTRHALVPSHSASIRIIGARSRTTRSRIRCRSIRSAICSG